MKGLIFKSAIISAALTVLTVGMANAIIYTEEYKGTQGGVDDNRQKVNENQTYDFGFDLWAANPPGFTNSGLVLNVDAETGHSVVWRTATLEIEFYDGDGESEIAHIIMTPWDDDPADPVATFDLGDFNPTDNRGLNFSHIFTQAQLAAFSKGWGNVSITAIQDADNNINDFSIKAVRLLVDDTPPTNVNPDPPTNPVPEPATMLLFGTGLAGLAGVARKKKA